EFVPNDAFDAANFFENANGEAKGEFRRNQFGASAGWKVLKDRAFLFGDYEGLRQVKAVSQSAKTLAPNLRLGILNDPKTRQSLRPLVGSCPFPKMTNFAPGRASTCIDNTIAKLIGSAGGFGLDPMPNDPAGLIGPGNNIGNFNTNGLQR